MPFGVVGIFQSPKILISSIKKMEKINIVGPDKPVVCGGLAMGVYTRQRTPNTGQRTHITIEILV
jgi:hypothetical protein